MKLVIDVHYKDNDFAIAAGLLFLTWQSASPADLLTVKIENIKPYQSGHFFARELPCILALLDAITTTLEVIIIDGYVTLGANNKKGLGTHLYHALDSNIPIIGVAKNEFVDTPTDCQILRGQSKKPLFITSIGIAQTDAKKYIQSMAGEYRLPTLLKAVDSACRNGMI